MTRPTPAVRDCTCLGSCKGAAGLAPGWRCALEASEQQAVERVWSPAPGGKERAMPTSDEIAEAMRGLDNITRAVVDQATAELRQRVRDLERELDEARRPLRLRCDPVPVSPADVCPDCKRLGRDEDWYDEVIIDRDPAGNPRFRTSRRALVECDDTEVLGPVLLTISVAE